MHVNKACDISGQYSCHVQNKTGNSRGWQESEGFIEFRIEDKYKKFILVPSLLAKGYDTRCFSFALGRYSRQNENFEFHHLSSYTTYRH